MTILPHLDEAIAYLQAEITALRAGEKDGALISVAVAVAAGEAPLPEPQFAPLLALWTPKEDSISTELATLVDQFEAARRREEEEDHKKEDKDVKTPVHSALERVRGQRRRPRTRPRRRFEDPDEGDASQSASDGTPTPSPRADTTVLNTVVGKGEEEKEANDQKENDGKEENDHEKKDPDVVMEEKVEANADEKQEAAEEKEEKKETVEETQKEKTIEKEKEEAEKLEEKEERNPEKEEAEAALASLKALRKSMLLDVLSKIVSVAKSKNVDPAMFSKEPEEKMVDLEKIQERVSGGVICEWAQFAEQVYLFCQEVVTDAEKREQPEARRKGVELLHFARTLTETLRKASVKKEATLLQKIRDAEEEAAARKEEEETARKEEKETDDKTFQKEEERSASINEGDDEKVKGVGEGGDVEMENATASEKDDQGIESTESHESGKSEASGPPPLTPTRTSTRIRKRTSITSDGTGSAAPSPSSHNPRKRTRGSSIFTASASEISGEESHDASASEADTKQRGGTKTPKAPAKRTRKRRPSVPATRTSSRQQKRRAEAAAATVMESGGSGVEEEHSGGEALHSADDGNEKEKTEETETGEDEHEEEQQAPKKKKTKTRTRKKGGRKR